MFGNEIAQCATTTNAGCTDVSHRPNPTWDSDGPEQPDEEPRRAPPEDCRKIRTQEEVQVETRVFGARNGRASIGDLQPGTMPWWTLGRLA